MDDAISRQAAIEALRKMQTYKMFSGDDMLLIDQAGAMTELMLLPSAEPKRGKWVDMGKDPATGKWDTRLHIYCSECGHRSDDKPTKYCPNCRSYNGGENEI